MNNYFIGIDFAKAKFDAVILQRDNLNEEGHHGTKFAPVIGHRPFTRANNKKK